MIYYIYFHTDLTDLTDSPYHPLQRSSQQNIREIRAIRVQNKNSVFICEICGSLILRLHPVYIPRIIFPTDFTDLHRFLSSHNFLFFEHGLHESHEFFTQPQL